MKLKSVEKVASWEYLTRYDVKYETPSGGEKVYEMFSRDPGIDSTEKLLHPRTDAVMIIMTDRARERFLLIREFRLELGREIYGLPAGLIDPGETPEQAARLRDRAPASTAASSVFIFFMVLLPFYPIRRTPGGPPRCPRPAQWPG